MGKGPISIVVKTVCMIEKVTGVGDKAYATMHSMRGTMALILLQAGHNDASIIKRTGHSVVETLRNYLHLQDLEVLRMQRS